MLLLPIGSYKVVNRYVTYSPSHRQSGDLLMNIQSTLRTAPNLCINVSLTVIFGSNGNSFTVCTQPDVCVCVCAHARARAHTHTHTHTHIHTHIFFTI